MELKKLSWKEFERVANKKIESLLNFIKPRNKIGIISHVNADPDALASALTLNFLIHKLKENVKSSLIFPEGISKVSKNILLTIGLSVEYTKVFEESYDGIFLVDASSYGQFGKLSSMIKQYKGNIFIIDHHSPSKDIVSDSYDTIIINEVASAIIIYEISKRLSIELNKELYSLILAGILYDTRRFLHVTPLTFKIVSELLEKGVNYLQIVNSLQQEMDISERIARLKASKRMRIFRLGDWLVVLTRVSAFEASAARAIISLGADVVFVAGGKGDELRISARISNTFFNKTGISLGKDLLPEIARKLNAAGGGHDLAGGINGKGDHEVALDLCLKILSEKLGVRPHEVSD